jgi:hypothetical protein
MITCKLLASVTHKMVIANVKTTNYGAPKNIVLYAVI